MPPGYGYRSTVTAGATLRRGERERGSQVARIDIPEGDGLERSRLWQHAPDVGKGIGIAGSALYTRVSLDTRVREVARMRIAQINQCHI